MNNPKLDRLRGEIDATDNKIKELFLYRMSLSAMVAEAKKDTGTPVYCPEREEAVLARLTDGLPYEDAEAVRKLYKTVFSISRDRQNGLDKK